MITIHAIMLISLGFLGATLLGLVIGPAYRRRIARLTRDQIKQAMPLTEAEIRADKDRLRADYAIVIHDLNTKLEKRTLDVSRQRVEINRRDAAISGLEGEVAGMRTSLEEHENARRVLEHTIMDRLPKVEQRLAEARKLLMQRDREIAKLSSSAVKQAEALEEATQINTQNRDEIHRLNAALATRAARSREGMGDRRFDGEVALRSEIEALRAKTRDQAALITRLQGLLERTGGALTGASIGGSKSLAAGALKSSAASENGSDKSSSPLGVFRAEDEIARLQQDLSEAEATLRSVQSTAEESDVDRDTLENELRVVKAQNEDQIAEIAKLKAALGAYRVAEASEKAIPGSKVAMKARILELTALSEEHSSTIGRLRAEVAASNEKLARQAMHFTNEMRRLGAGSMPMAMPAGAGTHGRNGTGEADVTSRSAGHLRSDQRRRLTDRISDPRQRQMQGSAAGGESSSAGAKSSGPYSVAPAQVEVKSKEKSTSIGEATVAEKKVGSATGKSSDKKGSEKSKSSLSEEKGDGKRKTVGRRGGLLDRITRMDSSK